MTTAILSMLMLLAPAPSVAMTIPPTAISVPAGQPRYSAGLNNKGQLTIKLSRPVDHLMGAKIKLGAGVEKVVFDRGVFSMWTIQGTKGADVVKFGSQGTVINKRRGGTFDMGRDSAPDRFVFTNVINVAACSAKHPEIPGGCHPLNHLQKVTIRNFGREDVVELQGRTYTYGQLRGDAFPGVPVERLRVEAQR